MFILQDLQEFAHKHNGKCLSTQYTTARIKYEWQCENGHLFSKSWDYIKNENTVFCQECKKPKITIEKLQELAESKGGKCLSTTYINSYSNYKWECHEGHNWEATWINVGYANATWCPHCYIWPIEKLDEFAIKKGGRCLELIEGKEGCGKIGRYLWQCENEHTWTASAYNVVGKAASWCPHCIKLTIDDCIKEAEKRGGKCLDTEYINKRTIMNWECEKGHAFRLRLGAVRNNGRWCLQCSIDRSKLDISEAHKIAEKNGGKCLSTEYVNCTTPLKWRCKYGHEWEVAFEGVKRSNNWCPHCKYKSELLTRQIFESLFGKKFHKKRPKILERLELDGYCEELNLAFEYNGIQHEKYSPYFHRDGPDDFQAQLERDTRKRELCEKNGIRLVDIPSKYNHKDPEKLRKYIESCLHDLGFFNCSTN